MLIDLWWDISLTWVLDYTNRRHVQFGELDGLAEYVFVDRMGSMWADAPRHSLATEQDVVRKAQTAFARRLYDLGVQGLRVDAAKRMLIPN